MIYMEKVYGLVYC